VNLNNRPAVLFLNDNPEYALKFDTKKQKVVVEKYVEGDQRFKFTLDPVGNPKHHECDCS